MHSSAVFILCICYCLAHITFYDPESFLWFISFQETKFHPNDHWTGKINFVEIRSFWHIFRSFDRMWSFFILSLQVIVFLKRRHFIIFLIFSWYVPFFFLRPWSYLLGTVAHQAICLMALFLRRYWASLSLRQFWNLRKVHHKLGISFSCHLWQQGFHHVI